MEDMLLLLLWVVMLSLFDVFNNNDTRRGFKRNVWLVVLCSVSSKRPSHCGDQTPDLFLGSADKRTYVQ